MTIPTPNITTDSFGNVLQQKVGGANGSVVQSSTFGYDEQNRITSGSGQGFTWQPNGDFTSFAGETFGYNTTQQQPPQPPHAVNTVASGGITADRFDYNLDGSMSVRNKDTVAQVLKWDSRNQLAQVTWGSPVRNEYYGYDENGRRIARAAVQNGSTVVTYYPFAHYEQTGSSGAGVAKYYFFAVVSRVIMYQRESAKVYQGCSARVYRVEVQLSCIKYPSRGENSGREYARQEKEDHGHSRVDFDIASVQQ